MSEIKTWTTTILRGKGLVANRLAQLVALGLRIVDIELSKSGALWLVVVEKRFPKD